MNPANTIERMRTRILGREGSDQAMLIAERLHGGRPTKTWREEGFDAQRHFE
jgi:hypothetical protein